MGRSTLRTLITLAILVPSGAGSAAAASIFFDWTSNTSGNAAGITATVTSVIGQGLVGTLTHNASAPAYVAEFASSHSVFFWNVGSPPPGNIDSSFSFSSPLPSGARLIILDLDVFSETAILGSSGSPLVLLAQMESVAGENSLFPNYNPSTGELVSAISGSALNDNEASIFDVAGLTSIDVGFRNGNSNSGIGLAIALPVPEPTIAILFSIGLLILSRLAVRVD